MRTQATTSDGQLLDLLRVHGPMGVRGLAEAMQVTPTAVRQRLVRLMGSGMIQREALRLRRGRPKHLYRLTEKGLRLAGSNLTDLALAAWREISSTRDPELRATMVRRVAETLAREYAGQIQGETPAERMRSLARLMGQRRLPVSVEEWPDGVAVMTTHACPYPGLAEGGLDVCAMERLLYSALLGRDVELSRCRVNGETKCRFQAHPSGTHPPGQRPGSREKPAASGSTGPPGRRA